LKSAPLAGRSIWAFAGTIWLILGFSLSICSGDCENAKAATIAAIWTAKYILIFTLQFYN
jgi:hypothetical protein